MLVRITSPVRLLGDHFPSNTQQQVVIFGIPPYSPDLPFSLVLILIIFAGEIVRVCGVHAGRAGAEGRLLGHSDPAQQGADPPDPGHRIRAGTPATAAHHRHGE